MVLAILQARTSSSRLPGKVLKPIQGRPLILNLLDRVARANEIDSIVVATSTEPSDDELAKVVGGAGFVVRRGSLHDVLGRFAAVLDEFEPESFVRLTGDNALIDPMVIDHVVRVHKNTRADYTSNAIVRTYPRGLDTEVVKTSALRQLRALDLSDEEREHVTLGIYLRPAEFVLEAVTQEPDRSALRWTVDYPEDFEFVSTVYRLLASTPEFGQDDIIALLEAHPELNRRESDLGDD